MIGALDYTKIPWSKSVIAGDAPLDGVDLLASIFAGQKQLMEKYHTIEAANGCLVVEDFQLGQLNDREVQIRLKDLSQRLTEELMEAMNELKNRPWKQTDTDTDRDAYLEEIADAFHFFVELCITSGMSADNLFSFYFRKHNKNQERQDSEY